MKLLRQLGYLFPSKQRWQMAGLFFLQLIETCLDFFGISLILPFVTVLTDMEHISQAGWYRFLSELLGSAEQKTILLSLTLGMMALYVLKNVYALFLTNLRVRFLGRQQIHFGAKMLQCYMHKPYTFHLQRNTAEIVRNVHTDVNGAFSVISGLFAIVSDVLIITALVIFLLTVETELTAAVLVGLALCSALYFLVARKKIRKAGSHNREYGAKMVQAIQQSMGGIKEVKIMEREQYFADVYHAAGSEYIEKRRRYTILAAIPSRLLETVCMCSIFGLISLKILRGDDLTAILPSLSAFAVAAIRLLPRANNINNQINSVLYQMPSLDALCEDLQESDRMEEARRRQPLQEAAYTSGDIHLENVSYTYPETDTPVLRNVNLHIPKGCSVGIVGVTGAGKTTLVDVILGLLSPEEGRVCYGSEDIRKNPTQWHRKIGYIPQNVYMTDDSIRKNVAMGVPDEEIDEAAVWRALENAQLADFVRSLKDGLDTIIGEQGVRISGGQRQRIGIARALYRDPEILFFDEATSALDNETEQAVMDAIHTLGNSKTMLLVAHRLTTIAACDKIFRVENGSVEETKL